jgi:TolB-like protein
MRDPESVDADGAAPSSEARAPVHFAGLILDLDGCSLARASGEAIPLTRGEFALLRFFATHPRRVLSRDMLLDATAGRRFEPFDRSVDVMVGRLRRKIEPDPKAPRLIVTVAGGYQFAAKVRDGGVAEQATKDARAPASIDAEQSSRRRLSIVVLPFDNIGGDPDQDYFVDGVTESLITDLSRIRDAFVIARNTAFAYRGKRIDVRAIGRELGVRYVLEGSVQRSGERMRVSAQLIDAENGGHIWAERFDQPVADLFDLQDAIVGRIATTLSTQLYAAAARRAEMKPTPDSMDLFFRGRAWLHRGVTPETIAQARPFFARAQALDPENVYAMAGEAAGCALAAAMGPSRRDIAALLAAAEAAAAKAVGFAPDYAEARYAMGLVLTFTKRSAQGVAAFDRALALNRNLVQAHAMLGFGKICLGRSEETEAHIHDAFRLSPLDPDAFTWLMFAGLAALHLGRNEDAAGWLKQSIDAYPGFPAVHFLLSAALGNLGQRDDARMAVQAGLRLNPTFSVREFRGREYSDNAVYLEQRERIIEGLGRAGAPA